MAYQQQAFPIPGADLPKYNNHASASIPAKRGVVDDTAQDHVKLPATSGGVQQPVGVTIAAIPAGTTGGVRTHGYAIVTASGAIAKGDACKLDDASGKEGMAKATTNAGDWILGLARSAAADGEDAVIDIRIFRY